MRKKSLRENATVLDLRTENKLLFEIESEREADLMVILVNFLKMKKP